MSNLTDLLLEQVQHRADGWCECTLSECGHEPGGCFAEPGERLLILKVAEGDTILGNVIRVCPWCHRNTQVLGTGVPPRSSSADR